MWLLHALQIMLQVWLIHKPGKQIIVVVKMDLMDYTLVGSSKQ